MAQWSPDTCQCVMTIDDVTGEPTAFVSRCSLHLAAPASQIAAECRAKNAAVNAALVKNATATLDQLTIAFDGSRNVTISKSAVRLATTPPLTLAQYVAAINNPNVIAV